MSNEKDDELASNNNNNNLEAVEDEDEMDEENQDDIHLATRSGRITRPPDRLYLHQHHIITQTTNETEYSLETARVIAKTIQYLNIFAVSKSKNYAFLVTYSLKKELKQFGTKGYNAASANGSTQREYTNKEDTTSPTSATDSKLLTATIEVKYYSQQPLKQKNSVM